MANLQSVILQLEAMGLTDLLVPFMLIFAVIFAILNAIKLFKKNINLVVALAISLLTIIPHITGSYPPCYDVVKIINSAAPKIGLVVISIIMFLLVVGLFGLKLNFFEKFMPYIAIVIVIITAYSFLSSNTEGCSILKGITLPSSQWTYFLPLVALFVAILFITGGKAAKKGGRTEEPY
jgi:hypothetical protein